MANPPVAAVKPNTITDVEPLHGQGQISAWRLQQQMIVVAHQHPTVKQQPASFHHLPHQRSEVQTVGIVPEDVLELVAAGGDVIPSPRLLNSQSACHALPLTFTPQPSQP